MISKKLRQELVTELKKINTISSVWTKDIETKLSTLIDKAPELVIKKGPKIVWEIYEDLKIRQSVDKAAFVHTKTKDNAYIKGKGRINRKKALFDMTWIVKQNAHRLNDKEIMHFVRKVEKDLEMPQDFDTLQTVRLRDDFLYFDKGKVIFHTLSKGKDVKKAIGLIDNSLIVIGRNKVFRINNSSKEIEDDKISVLGLLPLDTVIYSKDNLAFVWKL